MSPREQSDRVLFAWKKSDRLDDYHLHELDLTSGKVRQLTFGLSGLLALGHRSLAGALLKGMMDGCLRVGS
jgi:hypothetical protein